MSGHVGRILKRLACSWVDVFIQARVYFLKKVFMNIFRNIIEFKADS